MTFAETSASHKDTVGPCLQGLQDIVGRYRPGTHDPNDPDRRRILHSTDPSQVSGSISSPGTQKSNDLGLKLFCHSLLHEFQMSKLKCQTKSKAQMSKFLILNFDISLTFEL
jgi:hypothetical protein